jgi:hypothetical protein
MNLRYRLEVSQTEREQLTAMLRGGQQATRKLKRAQILLAADSGTTDTAIAASVVVSESTMKPIEDGRLRDASFYQD